MICCFGSSLAFAQSTVEEPKGFQLDFSNDPCGNPLMESQLWTLIKGKVLKIADGQTLWVQLIEPRKIVRVHISGIEVLRGAKTSPTAKEFLDREFLGKTVNILINPDWDYSKRKPKDVTGVVTREPHYLDGAEALLAEGLARFAEPLPYTLSGHTRCHYRLTEADAKAKKVGIWQ
jgi:endonuclease YncB( thermonuclease family)